MGELFFDYYHSQSRRQNVGECLPAIPICARVHIIESILYIWAIASALKAMNSNSVVNVCVCECASVRAVKFRARTLSGMGEQTPSIFHFIFIAFRAIFNEIYEIARHPNRTYIFIFILLSIFLLLLSLSLSLYCVCDTFSFYTHLSFLQHVSHIFYILYIYIHNSHVIYFKTFSGKRMKRAIIHLGI